jgi:hypothetical protein
LKATRALHWLLRVGAVGMLVAGVVLATRKFHRSDEQVELRRFVEQELPSLDAQERDVFARLATLDARPGPSPEVARALLVDDVVPRLIRLKKQATSVISRTEALKGVVAGYAAAIDKLIDACRTSVRAIDEPATADGRAALQQVRTRFEEARAAASAWRKSLAATCQQNGLST